MTIFGQDQIQSIADDKLNVARMTISLFDRVENTVGKGENAGYQHFLLFLQCFPNPPSLGSSKVGIVWERLKIVLTLYHVFTTFNNFV